MKPDVEKHIRIADETMREMEHLMAGGIYKSIVKRAYHAMLNAATAALLAKEIKSAARQGIISEFNDAFIKTGLLDGKFYKYFRQAFNSRTESDDPTFESADHRLAQTSIMKVKEFISACRTLCD
jgi:uncharacterized protein (UPF0332 family)